MSRLSIHHHINIYNEHSNISYCSICSSIIITTETKNEISTVKPKKFDFPCDMDLSLFLSKDDTLCSVNVKKVYLKIRQRVIRELKVINTKFALSYQTFFLAVTYLDSICSKLSSFEYDAIALIAKFCIILAAKFSEEGNKAYQVENEFRSRISSDYRSDEIYVLKLLNYDLNIDTSYSILSMMMRMGFLFEDEVFDLKKMHILYNQLDKMLYAFVESRLYPEMTPKQIALSIIGFARESLGLEAFSNNIRIAYGCNCSESKMSFYHNGLRKVETCLKVKKDKTKKPLTKSSIAESMTNTLMNINEIMYAM